MTKKTIREQPCRPKVALQTKSNWNPSQKQQQQSKAHKTFRCACASTIQRRVQRQQQQQNDDGESSCSTITTITMANSFSPPTNGSSSSSSSTIHTIPVGWPQKSNGVNSGDGDSMVFGGNTRVRWPPMHFRCTFCWHFRFHQPADWLRRSSFGLSVLVCSVHSAFHSASSDLSKISLKFPFAFPVAGIFWGSGTHTEKLVAGGCSRR